MLLWHMLSASIVPMLWWYAASRRGHHMFECPGNSSSGEASSSAADPAVETARANSRDMANSRSTAMLTGRPSLGWSTANSSEHHAALLQQNGPGQKTREMGSWCDMVQTRHARFPQEQCAWNQAGNPTTRRAEPAAFQVAEFRGICPVATCEPRAHRTSHTRRRSLTPPCLPAGGQQFCGPQSRPAGAVASRTRAPAAPGHLPRVARSGC